MAGIPADAAWAIGLAVAFVVGFALAVVLRRRPAAPERPAVENEVLVVQKSAQEDRFERLIRALPLAAITVDRSARVVAYNAVALRDFALDDFRTRGRALIEVIPSVDLERQVADALAGESSTRSLVIGSIDRERTFNVAVFPFDGGEGAVVVADDVTEAVALERVRRDFISNVSHELRTPLASIKLMVETVLLSEGDPEAVAMFLPNVLHEVDRMVQLIEDLLELARSESGRLPLRREDVDLGALAADVLHTFAQRAQTLEVQLVSDFDESVVVRADPNRLRQVMLNVVDNALRHTPAHGTITVSVTREEAQAVFSVRDTGSGIPYNDLPHIFERFYVVERSRARERSGTGLGLSIAKQLMEAHGGSIVAESDLGTGSVFACRLPVADPAGTA